MSIRDVLCIVCLTMPAVFNVSTVAFGKQNEDVQLSRGDGSCSAEFVEDIWNNRHKVIVRVVICGVEFEGWIHNIETEEIWTWTGRSTVRDSGALVLIYGRLEHVGGFVFIKGEPYWISPDGTFQPVFTGQSFLLPRNNIRVTPVTAQLYRDHPPHEEKMGVQCFFERSKMEESCDLSNLKDIPSTRKIDVLVAYTTESLSYVGNVDFHRILMQELTNWTFSLSGINLEVSLHLSKYQFDDNSSEGWPEFVRTMVVGREFRGLREERDRKGYDVIALVRSVFEDVRAGSLDFSLRVCGHSCPCRSFCGTDKPALLVDWQCSLAVFAFAHELGHLIGAGHRKGDGGCLGVCPNSHGFVSIKRNWGTIMAELPVRGGLKRLPSWSSPVKKFLSERMGGYCADNASILEIGGRLLGSFSSEAPEKLNKLSKKLGFCPVD